MPNLAGQALYAVAFEGVAVPGDAVVGDVDAGWDALLPAITKGALLQTVTIVGAAYAVLEMTNQYAKDREQFGKPIGAYQAVQYMLMPSISVSAWIITPSPWRSNARVNASSKPVNGSIG